MEFTTTDIEGLVVIEPKVFGDHRGYFFESFRQDRFANAVGYPVTFVQDNESRSMKGVLRGLHFQLPPVAQGKLVRVTKGAVLDVALDIRKDSSTFGKHFSIELNEDNKRQLWIPPGFAHGFVALMDDTVFQYKCTNCYSPENECAILWSDTDLNIDWKLNDVAVSEKDKNALTLFQTLSPF
jgi:dTDP-4-dehydrorhamnose 3,5-epimerase